MDHWQTSMGAPPQWVPVSHVPNLGSPRAEVETIEQRLQQQCELLTNDAPEPDMPAQKPVGKKATRASIIADLLDEHAFH